MEKRTMKPFRIYDWNKTVISNKSNLLKLQKSIPKEFIKEVNDGDFAVKINGLWKNWELTEEGTGTYPIFKLFIEDGSLEIKNKSDDNHIKKYSLKNSWIKICTKISCDNSKGIDYYSIDMKNLILYAFNNSFNLESTDKFMVTLMNELLISWIKDNVGALDRLFGQYKIDTKMEEDLSLLGWDTGFSTSFSNVNRVINTQKKYPDKLDKEFKFDNPEEGINVSGSINATFSPWQITTGADGQNVNFICPIKEGSIKYLKNTYQFEEDNKFLIQLKLNYLNVDKTWTDPTSKNDGNQVDLKIKTDKDENGVDAVIITKAIFPDDIESSAMKKMILTEAVKEWFNENIFYFEQIFSSFHLNATANEEGFQWIKPTTAYYGVASVEENGSPNLDRSVFTAMSMVEETINESPSHIVDARMLKAVNNESAYAINMPLFVKKWLLAGLDYMQVGTLDDYDSISNGNGFKNNKEIKFATFKNADNEYVPAYVQKDNLRMEVVNNQLKVEITDITWSQSSKFKGHIMYSQYYDLKLQSGVDKLGKPYNNVLIPVENSDPNLTIYMSEEDYNFWDAFVGEIVAEIVVSVVTGAIGKAIGKGVGKYLSKFLNKTSAGKWVLKIDSSIAKHLKEMFKGDIDIPGLNRIAKDNLNLIEEVGKAQAVKFVANKATTFGAKIWENKSKFIGAITGAALGSASVGAIISAIDAQEKENYSALPNIEGFVASTVGAIKWPDNSEFKLESAELRGVYLLGGKLYPTNKLSKNKEVYENE